MVSLLCCRTKHLGDTASTIENVFEKLFHMVNKPQTGKGFYTKGSGSGSDKRITEWCIVKKGTADLLSHKTPRGHCNNH
jgi:hypothetical protein